MIRRQCLGPAAWLWLGTAGAAFAAEEPARNTWALALQARLLHWGIWYTGLHRLDDGGLFGLFCCIVLTAFMTSAVGLMLFKARGVSFTMGWIIGLPVSIAAMLVYCRFKPFPTYDDLSWVFTSAGGAQLVALTIAWAVKSAFAGDDSESKAAPAGKGAAPAAAHRPSARAVTASVAPGRSKTAPISPDQMRDRMKLAVRGAGDRPKG